jgi:hypothetical protein
MSDISQSNGGLVVTHHVRVDPSRSMKSVTGDVQALLDEYGEDSRRGCALLASELIAQIVGREPEWGDEPVALSVQLHKDTVRLEATGRASSSIDTNGGTPEPLADWGRYILDRLSDRWGIRGGPRRDIWAEVEVEV